MFTDVVSSIRAYLRVTARACVSVRECGCALACVRACVRACVCVGV